MSNLLQFLISEESPQVLARLRADPSLATYRDHEGIPLLHDACQLGRRQVVEAILASGESASVRTPSQRTPLHAAVKRWIDQDQWVTAMERDDWAAPESIVELLILNGADVDARTASGGTPLHIATVYGLAGAVQVLLRAGADASVSDARGMTPLDLASQFGSEECADLLRRAPHGVGMNDEARLARVLVGTANNVMAGAHEALGQADMPPDIQALREIEGGRWQAWSIPAAILSGMNYYRGAHTPQESDRLLGALEPALDELLGRAEPFINLMGGYLQSAEEESVEANDGVLAFLAMRQMVAGTAWDHAGAISAGARLLTWMFENNCPGWWESA